VEEAGTVQGEGYIRQRRDHQAKGEENKVIMDCYPRVYESIGGVFTSIHQQSVRDKFSKIESYSAVIPSKQLHVNHSGRLMDALSECSKSMVAVCLTSSSQSLEN
jgi:hypothetical protein